MTKLVLHQIMCGDGVTVVRERIERKLNVETTAEPNPWGGWIIYFNAPEDINLDFLRPDALPPFK